MKKIRVIFGLFNLICGVLLIIGPQTLFKVCESTEKVMKCYWSTRALIGIGILIVVSALLIFIFKDLGEQKVLSILNIFYGLVAILIPKILIGGCKAVTMKCVSLTFPAVYLISSSIIIFSLAYLIYLIKVNKNEK
ncbi:MAG: DUF4418 family protein [Clostridiales bacterium]|nr:DUF4418 family protein [Clostridiales bacterium]